MSANLLTTWWFSELQKSKKLRDSIVVANNNYLEIMPSPIRGRSSPAGVHTLNLESCLKNSSELEAFTLESAPIIKKETRQQTEVPVAAVTVNVLSSLKLHFGKSYL